MKSWETMACIWVLDGVERGWDRRRDGSSAVAWELSEKVGESVQSGTGHVRRRLGEADWSWLIEAGGVDGWLVEVWVEDWLSEADGVEDWLLGDCVGVWLLVLGIIEGSPVEVRVEVGLVDCCCVWATTDTFRIIYKKTGASNAFITE